MFKIGQLYIVNNPRNGGISPWKARLNYKKQWEIDGIKTVNILDGQLIFIVEKSIEYALSFWCLGLHKTHFLLLREEYANNILKEA